MNVLITSGGTKTPIDSVRSITNTSSGKFGSEIATQLLINGCKLTHLHAIGSPTPFKFEVDLANARNRDYVTQLDELHQFSKQYLSKYTEETFNTYDDYAEKLESLCKAFQYDIVILCAAVSDYQVANKVDGKICSKFNLEIKLEPTVKLINKIKQWLPATTLVGFKLTCNDTNDTLLDLAATSIRKNGCDLVVANDLRDIQGQEKECWLVQKIHDNIVESPVRGTTKFIADRIVGLLIRNDAFIGKVGRKE